MVGGDGTEKELVSWQGLFGITTLAITPSWDTTEADPVSGLSVHDL